MFKSYLSFILTFSSIIFGCTNGTKTLNYNTIRITISSPYGCVYELNLSNNGQGHLIAGVSLNEESNRNIDSLFYNRFFSIPVESKMLWINSQIDSLTKIKVEKSGYKLDAYRFEVCIDKVCKIDVYGNSDFVNSFLKEIFEFLPLRNAPCDFWDLFKKTHV